jgi:hypothetical protein
MVALYAEHGPEFVAPRRRVLAHPRGSERQRLFVATDTIGNYPVLAL